MDYKKLHNTLFEILQEVEFHLESNNYHLLNPKILKLLNESEFYITVHDLERLKPIYINNHQKNYYGFSNNYVEDKDHFFYFLTLHPSCISTLASSIIYFKNGGKGYLNLEYKLKKYNGNYEKFRGATKSIYIKNEQKYAISVLEKVGKNAREISAGTTKISLLTDREREIALLYSENKTALEISAELGISLNTTKTHLKNIYRKLEINNVKELIREMKFLYL